jgi:hypothetical protein
MWLDVLAGRVSREEACQWAGPLTLGDAPFEDVMTGQGLQYLHGLDLALCPPASFHGRRLYLRTDQDVRIFERWQRDAPTSTRSAGCHRRGTTLGIGTRQPQTQ